MKNGRVKPFLFFPLPLSLTEHVYRHRAGVSFNVARKNSDCKPKTKQNEKYKIKNPYHLLKFGQRWKKMRKADICLLKLYTTTYFSRRQ